MSSYREILEKITEEGRRRSIPEDGGKTRHDMIDLVSNDYMGLSTSCRLYKQEFAKRRGADEMSSVASRLLSRRQEAHNSLERYLSEAYGRPALLFNSGYHANTGIIPSLAIEGTLLLSDKLAHASMIDGIRLSGCDHRRFRHNDMCQLEKILQRESDNFDRIIILTEGIFSMDGDTAPLSELMELKEKYPKVMIYLDEAHSFGTRGETGLGLAEEKGVIDNIDVIIGTLGKAAASSGAFCITNDEIHELLINTCRPLIFSTALPPACCAWSQLMIERLRGMNRERRELLDKSLAFAEALRRLPGVSVGPTESHIVPLITGDAELAVTLARQLREEGFDVLPIRRPTVPPGGERIRFSLNAAIDKKDLKRLAETLEKLMSENHKIKTGS